MPASLGDRLLAQVQLLVTASASAFRDRIEREDDPLRLLDFPAFGAGELGVRGIAIPASMLKGLRESDLDAIRDASDKARCPALLLIEDQPLDLADAQPDRRAAALERTRSLSKAAGILGCAQLGLSIAGEDGDDRFEQAASTVRDGLQGPGRFEVTALLEHRPGVTGDPGRLTDLIKKIGGFRIGSLPDFRTAHDTGDFEGTLRKLAPYAGTILATVGAAARGQKPVTGEKDVTPYDLIAGLEAVLAVGYQHAICLDHAGGPGAAEAIVAARCRIEDFLDPGDDDADTDGSGDGEDGAGAETPDASSGAES